MKTCSLSGQALNWAVATSDGEDFRADMEYDGIGGAYSAHCYDTDWSQAGPIIEREYIRWNRVNGHYYAWISDDDHADPVRESILRGVIPANRHDFKYGETLLIAAMRCFVAPKMGENVEVPDEFA